MAVTEHPRTEPDVRRSASGSYLGCLTAKRYRGSSGPIGLNEVTIVGRLSIGGESAGYREPLVH